MPLIFQLKIINNSIEENNDKYNYEIGDDFEGILNKELLYQLLNSWEFSNKEIQNINFIIDDEFIVDKNYIINKDEKKNILILTYDIIINKKLKKIFENYINKRLNNDIDIISSDEELNIPYNIASEITNAITINSDSVDLSLNDQLINKMNKETISFLNDSDFRNLLNIYIKKPELFNKLFQYIQHAEIIETSINNNSVDDNKLNYYNELAQKINFLGFNNDIVIKNLIKYDGHLNLTIRSLFQNISSI